MLDLQLVTKKLLKWILIVYNVAMNDADVYLCIKEIFELRKSKLKKFPVARSWISSCLYLTVRDNVGYPVGNQKAVKMDFVGVDA